MPFNLMKCSSLFPAVPELTANLADLEAWLGRVRGRFAEQPQSGEPWRLPADTRRCRKLCDLLTAASRDGDTVRAVAVALRLGGLLSDMEQRHLLFAPILSIGLGQGRTKRCSLVDLVVSENVKWKARVRGGREAGGLRRGRRTSRTTDEELVELLTTAKGRYRTWTAATDAVGGQIGASGSRIRRRLREHPVRELFPPRRRS